MNIIDKFRSRRLIEGNSVLQESPNTAQIEREHSEAEQRRQKLLIDRQQVGFIWLLVCRYRYDEV